MGFGGMLLDLIGEKDPRMAMLAALGPGAAGATQQAPGATQDGAAGGGAMPVAYGPGTAPVRPGAAPAVPSPTPAAYQSPPELMELYTQLMKRQNQEQGFDAGLGLLTSSLVQPANRGRVFSAVSGLGPNGSRGGAANDPMTTMTGMMKLQEAQRQLEVRAQQRLALPSIAKQYNIDLPTATYLFDTGKLDTVLSELLKPDQQMTELADGTKAIVNIRTGEVSQPFGPKKPQELEIKEGADGRFIAFNKLTGLPVGGPQGPAKNELTTEQKNWQADNADRAKRGQPEIGFGEWLITNKRASAGASNVGPNNVDYGPPPKDMQWVRDANGGIVLENNLPKAIVVPGSPTAIKNQKGEDTKDKKEGQQTLASTFVGQSIDDVLNILDKTKDSFTTPTTGLGGKVASYLDGTEANAIKETLSTIKANIGFEKLQQMRENSPTGGALGQVSDFENKLLQSVFGSLEQGQKDEYFVRNLFRVKHMTDAIVNNGVKDQAAASAIMKQADADSAAFVAKLRGKEAPKTEPEAPPIEGPSTDDLVKKYLGGN